MSVLEGKRVLIFQQRGWGVRIGHFLARCLQDEGCRLAALTIKNQTHDFVTAQRDVAYELIVRSDAIKENPREFLGSETISLAEVCRELGVDSVWQLVQASRNHVKSYADKYYYGFRQNLSDDEIADFIKANYKNIRDIFTRFGPQFIVTPNFAGLQHIMFNLYAARRGVPMMGVVDSKIVGITRFGLSYLEDKGRFFDRLGELLRGGSSLNEEKAKRYIAKTRENLMTPNLPRSATLSTAGLRRTIARELRPYLKILEYLRRPNRNRLSNLSATIDDVPPRYILRDHYMAKRYKRACDRFAYAKFPPENEYFYFPLQVQPEATIDVHAPRFNNQIETVRQVAMSMPDDYVLVVKDHPTMASRRPPSYLDKIARIPNVKLIDYRISTEEVLRRARVVVSPGSTTLAEAAFLGVPGIQLGELGTTRVLPNVLQHGELPTLGRAMRHALAMNVSAEEYERHLICYVAAAYDTGFEFDYYWTWNYGDGKNLEQFWPIVKREMEYLLSPPVSPIATSV